MKTDKTHEKQWERFARARGTTLEATARALEVSKEQLLKFLAGDAGAMDGPAPKLVASERHGKN